MSEHISQGLTAKACFVNVNDSRGSVYVCYNVCVCVCGGGVFLVLPCATSAYFPLVISHKMLRCV